MNILSVPKRTYSISDFYVFMKDEENILLCNYSYVFTDLFICNYIVSGELHIDSKIIPFEIDEMDIIAGPSERSNSIVIKGYRFTLL